MLGARIKELRQRANLSLDALSTRSGMPLDTLVELECGRIQHIDTASLMQIADSLKLRDSSDYLNLMHINKHQLRFKAYNVGLARTGTVTVARMFQNYRAAHEWQFFPIMGTIERYLTNALSHDGFRQIIKRRDVIMMREMDSASYNHYFLDVLCEEYPSARFLVTIRDCYSWLDSVFNTLPTWLPKDSGAQTPVVPTKLVFGIREFITWDRKDFLKKLRRHIDCALSFWGFHNARILKQLPRDRSLVVRTNELSDRVDEIAALVGVPPDSLAEPKRANRSKIKLNLLQDADPGFLEAKVHEHCSGVMEEWFPSFTLEGFLHGTDR